MLILALPLAVLGFASPWAGLCALLFGAGAIGFVSFGQSLATSAVPSRSGAAPVIRSRSFSAPLSLVSILWGVATAIADVGSWAGGRSAGRGLSRASDQLINRK